MPSSVWLFECEEELARSQFIRRGRSSDNNKAIFAKRYADYMLSIALILGRYETLLKTVGQAKLVDDARTTFAGRHQRHKGGSVYCIARSDRPGSQPHACVSE